MLRNCCLFEVMPLLEIRKKPVMRRMPSQTLLRERTRRGCIDRSEAREPPKVIGGFFLRYRNDRQVELAPNDAGDFAKRYTFVADCVVAHSRRTLLNREPKETRGVEPVVSVFRIAFERWIEAGDDRTLAQTMRDSLDALKLVSAGMSSFAPRPERSAHVILCPKT